jgi:hypothetical protein
MGLQAHTVFLLIGKYTGKLVKSHIFTSAGALCFSTLRLNPNLRAVVNMFEKNKALLTAVYKVANVDFEYNGKSNNSWAHK